MKKIIVLSILSLCAAQQMSAQWGLSGNALVAGNFLGSTNDMPLLFQVGGANAGRIESSVAGAGNTGIGAQSLNSLTSSGTYNSAFGYNTLYSNTYGVSNTAMGNIALYFNVSGNNNTAIGDNALVINNSGSYNTATGSGALYSNTASNNTAMGYAAMNGNTSGTNNTATGYRSLQGNGTASNNTANGYYTLTANKGNNNTAMGSLSLFSNTSGYSNTANGSLSLYYNTSGSKNTAMGDSALWANLTGSYNAAVGYLALTFNNYGQFNAAVGAYAEYNNNGGNYNCALGCSALNNQISGSNNVGLGFNAFPTSSTSVSNWVGIGYNIGGGSSVSNMVELGNSSVTSIRQQVASTILSDARIKDNVKANVPGLEFINKLRPVTYNLNIHRQNEMQYSNKKVAGAEWEGMYDIEKITQTGFLAQEVEQAAKDINYDFCGVDKPATPDGLYGIRYTEFVMPLVKSVQELSAKNDDLQQQVNELKATLAAIQQSLANGAAGNTVASKSAAVQGGDAVQAPVLGQNVPNPFSCSTVISCTIPGTFNSAKITVYSLSGAEMVSYPVMQVGANEITINCNTLAAGMYMYSLQVDGKVIDTKKMILSK